MARTNVFRGLQFSAFVFQYYGLAIVSYWTCSSWVCDKLVKWPASRGRPTISFSTMTPPPKRVILFDSTFITSTACIFSSASPKRNPEGLIRRCRPQPANNKIGLSKEVDHA
ncbi:hypothetical protein VKT23_016937 [Stygiomarasmius scandens]|uniref:Uncharacterized protein n=1 Tax=Marasmiellus scandens TaxID=2682957 RepID=A0ABR1IWA8_9AGAR